MARPLFYALGGFVLALGLFFASHPYAFAGQTININDMNNAAADVFGNGTLPNGAAPLNGNPNNNTVNVSNSTLNDVAGGWAESSTGNATASDNTVIINNSTVYGAAGGHAESDSGNATASGNSVTFNGGINTNDIVGGVAESNTGNAAALNNSVTINNATLDQDVVGGEAVSNSGSATATGNTLIINNSTVYGVAGGYAESDSGNATASGNSVTFSGGINTNDIVGARAESNTGNAAALNNSVTINNATLNQDAVGGEAVSNSGSATATGNIVIISNSTVYGVAGGYAESDSGNATASGNSVTFSGGINTNDIVGARAESNTGNAAALNNSVIINSATLDQDVVGGEAVSNSGSATATGNTVTIRGGHVGGNVIGGFAQGDSASSATGNTVTISDNPSFGGGTILRGGFGSSDFFTGNTLNVWNYTGSAVAGVENFQFFNFILPASLKGLEVTGTATLGDNTTGSTIREVSVIGSAAPVQVGQSVTLIDASNGTLERNGFNQTQATGRHGATLSYNWTLNADEASGVLTATLDSMEASPQGKALSEGFVTGMALATQGGDTVAGAGMDNAVGATQGGGAGAAPVIAGFGAMSAGSVRVKSGSHVDMNSVSLVVGLAVGRNFIPGRATLGAFFEYGTGSYDTYNSFATGSVKGKGDTRYYGGGLLGRMDFTNNGPGRFYTEASARMGRLHNEYKSNDLTDTLGNRAEYDSSTPYYGFHLGTGYVWNINDKASLDIFGKYFWTRVEGNSVTLSTGERIRFKNADSSRLRFGGRFAYAVNEHVSPYIGAAWEHEFDGKARATTSGFDIPPPSLRGDTGIGEIGLTFKPSQSTMPLAIDLGVQGYTGKREGVTGSLQLRFEF